MSASERPEPQDRLVSRRWFLDRMAWVSSVAAAGAVLPTETGAMEAAGRRAGRLAAELTDVPVRAGVQQDPTEMTLAETIALVRRGTIRPEEMVEAYADRVERFDGVLKAFAAKPGRAALLSQASRTPADGMDAPLRGACLAPKDNFYTADLLTEGGSRVYEGFQPDYDATVVASMRSAGGLMVGKAQMGNLAGGRAQVYGTTTPTTRNAWAPNDERYSPGGSSSGTATAVAARLAIAGLGTQTGGSVIGPGNLQGLTCIKPTFGRVSLHGVIPLSYTRDHVGSMARNALDAAILLQVITHPDANDPRTLGLPSVPNFVRAATPFPGDAPAVRWPTRIGLWPGYFEDDNEQVNTLRRAFVAQLERIGNVRIVPDVRLPEQWDDLTASPLGESHGDPTAFFIEALRKDVRDFGDRLPRFLNGMLQSADTYVKVQQARMLLLHRMQTQLFTQCDVVLTEGTGPFDGTGLPVLGMPIGMDVDEETGLDVPRGATLAALPFGEERLLAVAAAWQAVTDHHVRRPPDPTL